MEELTKPTPDVYTNEWYREQFRMLEYHWKRSMAEEVEATQQVRLLRKQMAEFEVARKADMVKIGELQERLDKQAKWIKENNSGNGEIKPPLAASSK